MDVVWICLDHVDGNFQDPFITWFTRHCSHQSQAGVPPPPPKGPSPHFQISFEFGMALLLIFFDVQFLNRTPPDIQVLGKAPKRHGPLGCLQEPMEAMSSHSRGMLSARKRSQVHHIHLAIAILSCRHPDLIVSHLKECFDMFIMFIVNMSRHILVLP